MASGTTGAFPAPSAQAAAKQKRLATVAVGKLIRTATRLKLTLAELFDSIDGDGSGVVDIAELRQGMLALGFALTDEDITAMMDALDADCGGGITPEEFVPRLQEFHDDCTSGAKHVLCHICQHLNAHNETAAAIFSRQDTDGGGSLDREEFHEALVSLGIEITQESAAEVLSELDEDGGGDLELVELTSRLDDYRRGRRSFAAQVLGDVLDFTARTNVSVTRVFAHVDADGSGDLDVVEFQTAMENMGQTLTELEITEVMSELDIDGSGTIEAGELLDKLKQFGQERCALRVSPMI
eukprot:COSAG02_NODE_1187_length_14003_cov_48.566240_3_plen_297_part_00